MKYLLLFGLALLVLLEVAISAPTTEDDVDKLVDELTRRLLDRKLARLEQREHENHKREMLESAAELTKAQMKLDEKRRGWYTGNVSNPSSKLSKFLESNPTIRRRGLAARTQLNVIQAYKKEWLKKRGNADSGDFWQDLNKEFDGHILHTRQDVISDVTSVNNPVLPDYTQCPFTDPDCTGKTSTRTYDGTCNNKQHPLWGSVDRAQIRLIPANYEDHIESVRTDLPSARVVANNILSARDSDTSLNDDFTYMGMQFGQFLDHDITSTPEASVEEASGASGEINCGESVQYGPSAVFVSCDSTNVNCLPIKIPNGDPIFHDGACMKFIRSEAYLKDGCNIEPRYVPNAITAWLDLSSVYSSDPQQAQSLKDATTGKMKTANYAGTGTNQPVNNLLPTVPNADSHCSADQPDYLCFEAGDKRSNEQIGLTSMHTVFVRMHNVIVDKLVQQESGLTPDQLYNMARNILIGLWQHMVYSEYLPVILGRDVMEKYGLMTRRDGYFTGYDINQTPDIITAFSTAAFRMGHTEIRSFMKLVTALYENKEEMALSEIQFNPTKLYTGTGQISGIDSVLMGLTNSSIGGWDRFFADQIRNHLFADNKDAPGFDLAARNIQRGRDHGLPGYLDYRQFCKLDHVRPTEFYQLRSLNRNGTTRRNITDLFKDVYQQVDDIDLYAGAMAERNLPGAFVGETFACIIALQFKAFKYGDRFYYENEDPETGFTPDQLREIRKFSLARLLCDTLESGSNLNIQRDVFRKAGLIGPDGRDNRKIPCIDVPNLDYSKFKSVSSQPPPPPSGEQRPRPKIRPGGGK